MLLAQQVVIEQPASSLIQQLTPLVAPVAALLGVWVGRILDSRARRGEPVRAAAIEGYSRFILRAHDCSRATAELLESSDLTEQRAHEQLRNTVYPLRLAASEMQLLAPNSVSHSATAVALAALSISDTLATSSGIDSARSSWHQPTGWPPLQDFEEKLTHFISQVKKDLGPHR